MTDPLFPAPVAAGILRGAMNEPRVYVLVINWNGMEHLRDCFDALCANAYPNVRFVLVDNASTDGSVDFVRRMYGEDPRVEVLECGANLGWSGGNNVGMEHALKAGADLIFLLNNDTAISPDCLERLVVFAEAHPEAGGIAPKMLLLDQPDIINSVGIVCSLVGVGWDEGLGRIDGPQWSEPRQVLGVCGGAFAVRSAALRMTGLLPTDFDIYLDDLDLSLRLWDAGYEVWSCPEATVRHKFGATMDQDANFRRKYYRNTRNRLRLILRNFPASSFWTVAPAYLRAEVKSVGRALLDGEPWRAWVHARSWGAGLAYVPRALRARREARSRGLAIGSFWPRVRKDCLFFHGVQLPEAGWYAPIAVAGHTVRPIAARAKHTTDSGKLRVTHANCYPRLGQTEVEIRAGDRLLAVLKTLEIDTIDLKVPPGEFSFVSKRLFRAEDTGAHEDFGGWIGIESR